MKIYLGLAAATALLGVSGTAAAHHSFAMFDRTKEVELKDAVVAKWEWTNPHIWLFLAAEERRARRGAAGGGFPGREDARREARPVEAAGMNVAGAGEQRAG